MGAVPNLNPRPNFLAAQGIGLLCYHAVRGCGNVAAPKDVGKEGSRPGKPCVATLFGG